MTDQKVTPTSLTSQTSQTSQTSPDPTTAPSSAGGQDAAGAEYRHVYAQLRAEAVDVLGRALALPVPVRIRTGDIVENLLDRSLDWRTVSRVEGDVLWFLAGGSEIGPLPAANYVVRHKAARPLDFADFLAEVLATVAANAGSIDRLTAGRPGSWEADLLEQFVSSTVGYDTDALARWRTAPVVVPLNVPELAGDVPGFPDLDDALNRALLGLSVDPGAADQLTDAEWDAIAAAEDEVDTAITTAHLGAYAAYAQAFTAAVHAAAARIPGLQVPVVVEVVQDPGHPDNQRGRVTNPDPFRTEDDALVRRLWEAAFAEVPTPTVPAIAVPVLPGTRRAAAATTRTDKPADISADISADKSADVGGDGAVDT